MSCPIHKFGAQSRSHATCMSMTANFKSIIQQHERGCGGRTSGWKLFVQLSSYILYPESFHYV